MRGLFIAMSKISRYEFISMTGTGTLALAWAFGQTSSVTKTTTKHNDNDMYGLIGKIIAKAGQREALIKILLEGSADMPGCLSYIVSKDSEEEDAIWITEAWDSKESHQASLLLPSVKEAISQGRPLIEEFVKQVEMEPAGGHGLVPSEESK